MLAVETALAGESPPPLALQKYLLAAGVGEVGGLGARAIYGDRQLTYFELQECWAFQQAVLTHMSRQDGGDGARRSASVANALRLERDGKLNDSDPNNALPEELRAMIAPGMSAYDPGPQ